MILGDLSFSLVLANSSFSFKIRSSLVLRSLYSEKDASLHTFHISIYQEQYKLPRRPASLIP